MPRRNDPKDAPADFDELLADEPVADEVVAGDEPDAVEVEPEVTEAVLTPAQQLLADARARKAARAAQGQSPAAPVDRFEGLSDSEIEEIKAIEDEEARANNQALSLSEKAPTQFDNSRKGGTGEKILFHVLKDGFTAFGDVWYRGQEIEVEVGTAAYKRTLDKHGNSWLDLVDDEHAQYDRWRERRIAPGEFRPLPGEKFEDELVSEDKRRKRTVPIVAA